MKKNLCIISITTFLLLFFSNIVLATTELATFESFYKESSYTGWILAGIFAVLGAAAVYFTGGTAGPVVQAIGTWIGEAMGLSGIAATNAGLALLGGGSIASGGLGIAGGIALLNAALSFSTDIIFNYTISTLNSEYHYSQLVENSRHLPTLPVPVNDEGPEIYEETIKILKKIDPKNPIFSTYNQNIISKAKTYINNGLIGLDLESDPEARLRLEGLRAILEFITNNYQDAKQHAYNAILLARRLKLRRTLPAFIYATSSLYDKNLNFKELTQDYFRYSILAEPDNGLIPLLFSIYLDRILLRMNDNAIDTSAFYQLLTITEEKSISNFAFTNNLILFTKLCIRLKLNQQKISSLCTTTNETIKKSPKTLNVVKFSMVEYNKLLKIANIVINKLRFLVDRDDEKMTEKVMNFYTLFNEYEFDTHRLEKLIKGLEEYQINLKKKANESSKHKSFFERIKEWWDNL